MNRREFSALIAGSLLFPQKLWSATNRPQLPASIADDDHIQYYPLYFRRSSDSDAIYELWQPGIILGVGYFGGQLRQVEEPFRVEVHSPHRPSREFGGGLCYTLESMGYTMTPTTDLAFAFRKCMGHGMIVVDGDVVPYRATGSKWYATSTTPLLFRHDHAVSLVGAGELEPILPKYTHKEYVELCYSMSFMR